MVKLQNKENIALIDVGSNTIRLVIFDVDTDSFYNISEAQNIKVPARLVQYVENGKMNEEGIQLLIDLLSKYLKIIEKYNVGRLIAVATAAVRNSSNVKEIVRRVKKKTGLELDVFSEAEEAYYGNYAVRYTFNILDGISVDIGGGSTEVTLFKNKEVVESHSFPFGAVSLADKFFRNKDHSNKKSIKEARKWIKEEFKKIKWLSNNQLPLIGIGGSARNIGEVYQLQHDYPIAGIHGYSMAPESVDETLNLFSSLNTEEMGSLDGLSQDRRDTIIPANLVFQQLLVVGNSPAFIISNRGLREGILIEYLNEAYNDPYDLFSVQQQTIVRLSAQYNIREISTNQRITIADMLLNELERNNLLSVDVEHLQLMYYGATLYNLGSYIENDSSSQHTFYVITNTNISGFDHYDRVRLALLASYKNRSLYRQYLSNIEDWFSKDEKTLLMKLGSIIKFAEALNDVHVNTVEKIKLEKNPDSGFDLNVTYSGDIISEDYRANKQLNHFERAVGENVNVNFTSET